MPIWVAQLCDMVTGLWMTATPADYGRASLLIVVLGWVLTKRPFN